MPGVYEELGSRGPAPAGCEDVYERTDAGQFALTYEEQRQCPNAQNLIAILGDTNGDRHLRRQVQHPDRGHRATTPDDVLIEGERVEAERHPRRPRRRHLPEELHGRVLGLQQHLRAGDERVPASTRIVSRYSREYGILSFTSDHGIYENCETSATATPACTRAPGPTTATGSRTRTGTSTGSRSATATRTTTTSGSSGTAGNGTLVPRQPVPPQRDRASRPTRSRAATPGMPQDDSKWTHNLIYSNNNNLFNDERDAYCQAARRRTRDPTEGVPDVPGAGRHRAS